MNSPLPATALQLRSLISADGTLELALHEAPVPTPAADEVLIRIEATPINPSDIGLLFGAADLSTMTVDGPAERPRVRARVPEAAMPAMAGRAGQALPVGNEGCGTVVAAGASPAAQALLGRRVAAIGGGMYAQYRAVKADACLLLPAGATPQQGASCFVNPLTALGFVQTMKREGHTALVHTAAASNLGQMLHRICRQDGIGLVNIVRKPEQAALLRGLGAEHVVDSSAPDFEARLVDAVAATGATLAFDATGGGTLASQILVAMEAALLRKAGGGYSRYGTDIHKQVYLYGNLDISPTVIHRRVGMAWGVGGWLVFPYLAKLAPEAVQALKQRVADELTTTFASHYSHEVSLAGALSAAAIAGYTRRATGEKYLITP
jgi:NADPH:quinone reductase-like Zn-dependent oxidoreductase